MALPYEVEIQVSDWTLLDTALKIGHITQLLNDDIKLRPYLRPMSSMTDEERKEYEITFDSVYDVDDYEEAADSWHKEFSIHSLDWLLKKHFDFMGLIHKGLAIAVTKENNPYEKIN